jgi:hypothetical protein
MATVKISELTELNDPTQVTANDLLHIINKEEYSTNYPAGTNKRIKAITLANGLAGLATTIPPLIQLALDSKASAANFNNAGLKIAVPVVAATTEDINLANSLNGVFIDGVQLAVNDRVLIKDQTLNKFNGIYIVNSGAPTRATDFNEPLEINGGYVLIKGGTTQKGAGFAVTTIVGSGAVDTDPIVFTQFSSAVTNIDKASVGLGRVDNTNDAEKDISDKTLAALALKQGSITGAASTITTTDLTINRALVSSSGGKVVVSTITSTELGRLTGITGDVQTLLDEKAPRNNPTFTGTVTLPTTTTIGGASVNPIPSGAVMAFAMNTAPTGWLACNGTSISTGGNNASLFAAIGYTYGGSGGSFKLPDLRGYFVRGLDNSRGIDPSRALGSDQADEFKSHKHKITKPSTIYVYTNDNSDYNIGGGFQPGGARPASYPSADASEGGTETRPKNIAMLYCIKL